MAGGRAVGHRTLLIVAAPLAVQRAVSGIGEWATSKRLRSDQVCDFRWPIRSIASGPASARESRCVGVLCGCVCVRAFTPARPLVARAAADSTVALRVLGGRLYFHSETFIQDFSFLWGVWTSHFA